MGAAGAAGGDVVNVENVFNSYIRTSNGTTATVTNNIDLSTEGGLLWTKSRSNAFWHVWYDTERGGSYSLTSNNIDAQATNIAGAVTFNNNGYSIASGYAENNASGYDYVDWVWRKAPNFFDVQTYTGNGSSGRTISHDLGSTPGLIIIKRTNSSRNWILHHRSTGFNQYAVFNTGAAFTASTNHITAASGTTVTVGSNSDVNANGSTYVMYVFAHNNNDGGFGVNEDQDIIKCGAYYGNSSTDGTEVSLGFEPQWVMLKNIDVGSRHWAIFDNMRGVATGGTGDNYLEAGTANAEANPVEHIEFNADGFKLKTTANARNASGYQYAYMAIRRGPMGVPESASDVFDVSQNTSASGSTRWQPNNISTKSTTFTNAGFGFSPDMCIIKPSGSSKDHYVAARLLGSGTFATNSTAAYSYNDAVKFNEAQNHVQVGAATDINSQVELIGYQAWKRAPNYFDTVAYAGNDSVNTIDHNLSVAPEMMWIKANAATRNWFVYHKDVGLTKYLELDNTSAQQNFSTWSNSTAPTSTQFTVNTSFGNINNSSYTYIAFLFSSLDNVSKVGSYTGTGSDINVDCGFSNGASWVMVKCFSHAGSWQMYNTAFGNGIASGNDSFTEMEGAGGIQSSQDRIDPYSAGFTVPSTAGGDMNLSGRTYIFYAIAA